MLQVPGEIRTWQEDENPFELIAKSVSTLRPGATDDSPLAVDSNVRFFITDAVTKAGGGRRATVSGGELVRACRMVKSPAELALMEYVKLVTEAAYRSTPADVEKLRRSGWTENQIAEAVYITALFAFFNRVADAFGVPAQDYLGTGKMTP